MRHLDGLKRLRDGPDLIQLDQHGISDLRGDTLGNDRGIRHEYVVADKQYPFTQPLGQLAPAVPVVFRNAVFDRHDRECVRQFGKKIDNAGGRERR